jgi:purine catabolism regulator
LQSVDTPVQELGLEPAGRAERGLDAVAAVISAAVEGGVLILSSAGRPLAHHDPGDVFTEVVTADLGRELVGRDETLPRILVHRGLAAGAYALPVMPGGRSRPQGWVVVATEDGRVDESLRLIVRQAAAIVALDLSRRGSACETERRLTAELVGDAIFARTDRDEQGRRLTAFGIGGEVAVAVFTVAGVETERCLQEALATAELPAAVSIQEVEGRELLCAIVEVGARDPIEVAAEARRDLAEAMHAAPAGEVLAAVSRARPAAELPRTFQEAYWALGAVENRPASARSAGDAVGSWRDLGVESLLLSVGDPDVLRLYCDRLLGPVLAGDSVYTGELLHSLELFILHNGQWERAARELHCHRHTLRYRMRKVEELTGRDLSSATDRIEFWLALRARDLSHPSR